MATDGRPPGMQSGAQGWDPAGVIVVLIWVAAAASGSACEVGGKWRGWLHERAYAAVLSLLAGSPGHAPAREAGAARGRLGRGRRGCLVARLCRDARLGA